MWYVIQVKTGDETAVRKKLQEMGIRTAVPMEKRPIRNGGEWNSKEYTLFPSYVFIKISFTADNYYKVRRIPNVIRFLGEAAKPTPLSYLEAEWICILSGHGEPLPPSRVREKEDGTLEIIGGVLAQFVSKISKIDKRSRKATFEMTICNEIKEVSLGIELVEDKKLLEGMG